MKREKDPFSNPVGNTFRRVIEGTLDGLIADPSSAELASLVTDAMRLRAVQSFTPATAVGFLFELKPVVREVLGVSKLSSDQLESLLDLETEVDRLVLRAFDTYMACREKVYEIKATELRQRSERVVQKLNERMEARARERESSERGGEK